MILNTTDKTQEADTDINKLRQEMEAEHKRLHQRINQLDDLLAEHLNLHMYELKKKLISQ